MADSRLSPYQRAQQIQAGIENRRLRQVTKRAPVLTIALLAVGMVGLVWAGFNFEENVIPAASADPGVEVWISDTESIRLAQQPDRFLAEAAKPANDRSAVERNRYWVDPASSFRPWSEINPTARGLLTFRGNPTRTFYGQGPVPDNPTVIWSRKIGCSVSHVGENPKEWCGTGWTGQPVVFPSPQDPSKWWVAVGGYNKAVNFFDPDTGRTVFEPYFTNDIIKGTVTVDPDGYPLLYTGSRDDYYHIVALDGDKPHALWKLSAESDQQTYWNNDWDSSGMVIGDYLFLGGENSRFYIIKLNRSYDTAGKVQVDPVEVFSTQAWDDKLLRDLGDKELSIENSVAVSGNTVYFANSGGLVQGWNIEGLAFGERPRRTFRYWVGDDTDGSISVDADGFLYVASQFQRDNARSREIGQVVKLDPTRPDDPLVWSVDVSDGVTSGVWATPGHYKQFLIVPTDSGDVLGIDKETGEVTWTIPLGGQLWSSPVIIEDRLIQGDCSGNLNIFSLESVGQPEVVPNRIDKVRLASGGCVESTPAVWGAKIFVGVRNGVFYAVGDGPE